jgi:hypothetical protein
MTRKRSLAFLLVLYVALSAYMLIRAGLGLPFQMWSGFVHPLLALSCVLIHSSGREGGKRTAIFAALVIAQPNFFGCLEDVDALTNWAHANNMLVIAVVNPTSLALLVPPGEWGDNGVDIVVGEGQPLGIPLSSGGPYFGFMCCKQQHVRQMPGRIIGRTVDLDGKPGFALTLQAREQHIRRSKAGLRPIPRCRSRLGPLWQRGTTRLPSESVPVRLASWPHSPAGQNSAHRRICFPCYKGSVP